MADITDLTGYTWTANEKLEENAWIEHNLNFTTKDGVNYTKFIFYNDFDTLITYLKYNDDDIYSFEFQNEHWIGDDNKKSFLITGGDDVTSLILIPWLQENGTLSKGVNKLKLGTLDIASLKLGTAEIKKAYLGSEEVYNKN